MTQDDGYSRRQLLQAITVAGGLGAAGGTATGAYLSDRELFSGNLVGTGEVTLELATDQAGNVGDLRSFSAENFRTDTTIDVGFPEVQPGDVGVLRVAHRLGEHGERLWMQTTSSTETDLGTHIDVSLVRRPACDGDETNLLFQGTIDELTEVYADGKPIGDDCLDGQSCLDLEWELREDVPAEFSEESVSYSLDFTAVQCRHTETDENP